MPDLSGSKSPNYSVEAGIGWCLGYVSNVFGISTGRYPSATLARYSSTVIPGSPPEGKRVILWFDHWGTYQGSWGNWGHVAILEPGVGIYSSPATLPPGKDVGFEILPSIRSVEIRFNSTYVGWSTDLAGTEIDTGDDVLNNDDKKWFIDTIGHMLAFTAREGGVSADGRSGMTLFEKIDSIPAKLLDTRIPRRGGPEGETSLRGTLAWLDANLQSITAAVKESAIQQGVDPAVIEKAIKDALKNVAMPSVAEIADAVVDEQAERLGGKNA